MAIDTILEAIEAAEHLNETKLQEAERALVRQVAAGKLADPTAIKTQLAALGMTTEELRAGVMRLERRTILRQQAARERDVAAKLASLEEKQRKLNEAYDKATVRYRAESDATARERAALDVDRTTILTAKAELRDLLDGDERAQIEEIDQEIADLGQRRDTLQNMLRAARLGGEFIDVDRQRRESYAAQVIRLESHIAGCERDRKSSQNADHRAKLDRQIDHWRGQIQDLQVREAADRRELADIERQLASLIAQRRQLEDEILIS